MTNIPQTGLIESQRDSGQTVPRLGAGCGSDRRARCVQIRQLYVSPGHNFFGHYGQPPGENVIISVPEIECVAGRGILGDRFFDYKPGYRGQITFFEMEVFAAISHEFGVRDKAPSVFRRNVITEGSDLNSLIGVEFEIQGLRFRGEEECRPCHWMNGAFGPGAEQFLKGRGGLRAVILKGGKLRVDVT
jgi:MOSC domain-containing protein YiiM